MWGAGRVYSSQSARSVDCATTGLVTLFDREVPSMTEDEVSDLGMAVLLTILFIEVVAMVVFISYQIGWSM